ncbi:MAG TPA: 1,4-beta-xylanase, partial [Hyphomonas atlantica]|nr:1,4-beta-xylanase [Hyphomonas atlantica]
MTRLTRRHTLAMLASAAGTAACATPESVTSARSGETPPLKDLAAAKGIRFGTSMDAREVNQAEYLDIVLRDCAVIVAENEHKMYTIQPTPDAMNWVPGDTLVNFAKANGLGMRGHTLIWQHPDWLPDWVNQKQFASAAEAEALLGGYIERVASRHSDFIYSWDVVNETIDPETGDIRETS